MRIRERERNKKKGCLVLYLWETTKQGVEAAIEKEKEREVNKGL